MPQKQSKNRALIPTTQLQEDCLLTCSFREVLDNVKLITNMKFQKIWMPGFRDTGKKHKKCLLKWGFPTMCDFLQKSGSASYIPLWCPNFMQNFRKLLSSNNWSPSNSKKDRRRDRQGRLLKISSGKPRVQKSWLTFSVSLC